MRLVVAALFLLACVGARAGFTDTSSTNLDEIKTVLDDVDTRAKHIPKDTRQITLLGGIGGYVLSQGVGRTAARAAVREQERLRAVHPGGKPPTIPG